MKKNNFSISKEILVIYNLDDNKNGTVEFKDIQNNTFFTSIFVEGKPEYIQPNNSNNNYQSKLQLCQQEGNKGFRGCFTRESNEFQSNFISNIIYLTNSGIAILIATLCSCKTKNYENKY